MAMLPITIQPGGQYSDIVDKKLGNHQHKTVQNLRQVKIGEWQNIRGYLNSWNSGTSLINGIEIKDDISADRFIIFQDGANLKRLDYDISNSPNTGYENEIAVTLTMPSGVTIGVLPSGSDYSHVYCRFFYNEGVIRISGPSNNLWYGYIDNVTLFPDSWEEIYTQDMNTAGDQNDFTAELGATLTHETTIKMEGAGCAEIIGASNLGCYRTISSLTSGKKIRIMFGVRGDSGNGGLGSVQIGTSTDRDAYYSATVANDDNWKPIVQEITLASDHIKISIDPLTGDTMYFDYIVIHYEASIALDGWYLEKVQNVDPAVVFENADAGRNDQSGGYVSGTQHSFFMKAATNNDNTQFGKLFEATRNYNENGPEILFFTNFNYELNTSEQDLLGVDVRLSGSSLKTSWTLNRMRRLLLFSNIESIAGAIGTPPTVLKEEDSITFRNSFDLPIDEALPDIQYVKYDCLSGDAADTTKIYFDVTNFNMLAGEMGLRAHSPITIINGSETLTTFIVDIQFDYNTANGNYIIVAGDHSDISLPTSAPAAEAVGFIIPQEWWYDSSTGYTIRVGIDYTDTGDTYADYVDFSQNVEDIDPDYSHHVIIDNRAFIKSEKNNEDYVIRFSPLYQFDTFPNDFVIKVRAQEGDSFKALTKLNERLVILNESSIIQGNYTTQWREDIASEKKGLYATNGFLIIDKSMLIMDLDDVHEFNGVSFPRPIMMPELQKEEYKSYVSTKSFMGYNKIDDEVYFFLNGKTLVWHRERNEWYTRSIDITPTLSIYDSESRLIIGSAAKFVLQTHSESTWDESIICKFITGLKDLNGPHNFKQCHLVKFKLKSNKALTLRIEDEAEGDSSSETKTPDASDIKTLRFKPSYFFKELLLTVTFATGTNCSILIKDTNVIVKHWRNAP